MGNAAPAAGGLAAPLRELTSREVAFEDDLFWQSLFDQHLPVTADELFELLNPEDIQAMKLDDQGFGLRNLRCLLRRLVHSLHHVCHSDVGKGEKSEQAVVWNRGLVTLRILTRIMPALLEDETLFDVFWAEEGLGLLQSENVALWDDSCSDRGSFSKEAAFDSATIATTEVIHFAFKIVG
jgi:hypothetical protein